MKKFESNLTSMIHFHKKLAVNLVEFLTTARNNRTQPSIVINNV